MKITRCMDHGHDLREDQVTVAREIGRKFYLGEPSHRPEESVWAWVVVHPTGLVCHGYGSEPNCSKKQYMKEQA